MLESKVEKYLVKRIEAIGGLAYKFTSLARRSVPDRLVLLPEVHELCDARAVFVELKAPGKKPTLAQYREHERLQRLGFRVEVLDSTEAVDEFVEGL